MFFIKFQEEILNGKNIAALLMWIKKLFEENNELFSYQLYRCRINTLQGIKVIK